MYDLKTSSPMQTYLEHCARGELAYQVAPDGTPLSYPRVVSPGTGADRLEWRVSKGLGTVYAVTIVRNRNALPHNVVLVDLDEGFRIMSTVEETDPESVRIGDRVSLRMKPGTAESDPYPIFVPLRETR